MPIVEDRAQRCFDRFRDHVGALVTKVLSPHVLVRCEPPQALCQTISFWQGQKPVTIPVETSMGTLHFYLGQALEAEQESRRSYRLRTLEYWYRLQANSGPNEKALIRWEYVSTAVASEPTHCRHHIQLATSIETGLDAPFNLNRLHVPTGWVTFEEVIRFLITDLGFEPPCGDEWPQVLAKSEKAFFEEFTSKRYKG